MIGKGTRWKAKKERGGLFAYTILDNTAEDLLRSRPSSTAIHLVEHPVAEIPHHAGSSKERAEIAYLIERAPLMREVLLEEAASLMRMVKIEEGKPGCQALGTWMRGIADRLLEAAHGKLEKLG